MSEKLSDRDKREVVDEINKLGKKLKFIKKTDNIDSLSNKEIYLINARAKASMKGTEHMGPVITMSITMYTIIFTMYLNGGVSEGLKLLSVAFILVVPLLFVLGSLNTSNRMSKKEYFIQLVDVYLNNCR